MIHDFDSRLERATLRFLKHYARHAQVKALHPAIRPSGAETRCKGSFWRAACLGNVKSDNLGLTRDKDLRTAACRYKAASLVIYTHDAVACWHLGTYVNAPAAIAREDERIDVAADVSLPDRLEREDNIQLAAGNNRFEAAHELYAAILLEDLDELKVFRRKAAYKVSRALWQACIAGLASPDVRRSNNDQIVASSPLACSAHTGQPGLCSLGTTVCTGGAPSCEQTTQPSAEVCDGLDNNCDGTADEGNPGGGASCTTGQPGLCSAGTTVCSGGTLSCEQTTQPSAEVCDGVDNDCNGVTDDNPTDTGQACTTGLPGVCSAGTTVCSAGALSCAQTTQPSGEICGDRIDQDCDGQDTVCPPPAEFACPLTQGFWKTHSEAWPVLSLTLGIQTYTQTDLLTILSTPVKGDASLILADQLIAAKLNIADGFDPAPISVTITHADSLLSEFTGKLPYGVKTSSATGQAMVNDASMLDSYNNGQLTPDCTP